MGRRRIGAAHRAGRPVSRQGVDVGETLEHQRVVGEDLQLSVEECAGLVEAASIGQIFGLIESILVQRLRRHGGGHALGQGRGSSSREGGGHLPDAGGCRGGLSATEGVVQRHRGHQRGAVMPRSGQRLFYPAGFHVVGLERSVELEIVESPGRHVVHGRKAQVGTHLYGVGLARLEQQDLVEHLQSWFDLAAARQLLGEDQLLGDAAHLIAGLEQQITQLLTQLGGGAQVAQTVPEQLDGVSHLARDPVPLRFGEQPADGARLGVVL